jgi:anoctamin-10
VAYLINNWIELRSDSVKICFEMRRPVPDRVDSIGLWLTNLGFLTWLGSITSAALVYLFSTPSLGQSMPDVYTLVGVFGAIVFSEHIYIVARIAVRTALSKFESPGLIKRRQEKFLVKRRLLQESLSVNEETENSNDIAGSSSVEDDVEAFWSRQKGAKGAFEAGITIINNSKKAQ